jgi:valacyclovir hydrolase
MALRLAMAYRERAALWEEALAQPTAATEAGLHFEETGTGNPLLFLPGFSASFNDYVSLRAVLSQRYRVISIDLPGSGRSGPQPRTYTRSYLEEDATTIAAFLRSRVEPPVHLVGHSDGGEIGLLIAALYPGIASSVIAWGATGFADETHRGAVAFFHNVLDDTSEQSEGYRTYLIDAYGEANARAMTQGFARAITAIIDGGGDISRSRAGQIRCPVLLMAGEHDVFASKALIDAYASRVPVAETVVIAGGGHDIHATHREAFEQKVLGWLASH